MGFIEINSAHASGLDATTKLTAEAYGCTGTKDWKRARNFAEVGAEVGDEGQISGWSYKPPIPWANEGKWIIVVDPFASQIGITLDAKCRLARYNVSYTYRGNEQSIGCGGSKEYAADIYP